MNVGKLKELIKDLPDDIKILASSSDHSYREVDANIITALYDKKYRNWTEDYGEKTTPEKEYGKRLSVIIFD